MNFFSNCTADDSSILKANEPMDGDEQNPPIWPKSVTTITKDMSNEDAQAVLTKLEDSRDPDTGAFVPKEHFSSERKAIFFEPRDEPYQVDVQVGYYVQLMGLGASASDVTFADTPLGLGPYCPAYYHEEDKNGTVVRDGTSLDTFWRSAENFTNDTEKGIMWAVSQAAPIRRVHAKNDLFLSQGGAFASGGHIANARVDGKLVFGPQQQFCARSITMGSEGTIVPGAWSNVYVDCIAPNTDLTTHPRTATAASVTANTPSITVEKCFLAMESKGSKKLALHVPRPRQREDASNPTSNGADLSGANDDIRPLERVYVAKACLDDAGEETDYDVARKINEAFRQGKDVVLSPGIYHLKESIQMMKNDQVLLGIGMATLVAPVNGQPCIRVAPRTEGVRIGGIMFEASQLEKGFFSPAKSSFIEFGREGALDAGNALNPGVLSDIFCRVGGSNVDRDVSTNVMVRIHSGNVLGCNLWCWRSDHVRLGQNELPNFPDMDLEYHQTVLGEVPVETGLEVNGDDVVIHGLAVEHTTQDQVVWNGSRGQVWFYQCELPYDVDQTFGTSNYVGFRSTAKDLKLGGAGIYSNFRDANVLVKTGMVHPRAFNEDQVINPFIVHLNNQGRIMTVVSDGTELGGGPVHASYDDKGEPVAMVAQYPALPEKEKAASPVKSEGCHCPDGSQKIISLEQ